MAAKILMIYTGGTIGMVSDPSTGALKPLNFREIESEIPALRRLGVEIEYHEGFTPIDSSDVTPTEWARLAETIRDNYARFDGFVVLHGTDTMAYTASALSFMLENLAKPVVFTGSQIPIGVLRTDGRENLVTAVEIAAASDKEGKPMVPEVSIYFQNRLFRANRTTKWSAEQLNAFTSENYPPLAEVGVTIHYNTAAIASNLTSSSIASNLTSSSMASNLTSPSIASNSTSSSMASNLTSPSIASNLILPSASADGTSPDPSPGLQPNPLIISTKLSPEIALIRLFPGMQQKTLEAALNIDGLQGVVMQTYGAGNTPTAPWFFDTLTRAISRGVVIVNVTQCIAGGVHPIYESGYRLARAGVTGGADMTPEAAITKLMYVLGRGLSPAESRRMVARNLRGELTP